MSKLTTYFQNSYRELAHVKWPTKKQILEITGVVLLFTFGAAALVALLDWILGNAFTKLLS